MTEPAIRVAPMEPHHVPACARVIGALDLFRAYDFTPPAAERVLGRAIEEGRADLRVALDGETVAGFVWFVPRGAFDRSGYLRLIAVEPKYRSFGVGRLLMRALEETHLRQGGIVLLSTGTNEDAHRFYERLGYRRVGALPDYVRPGLEECIFFKPPVGLEERLG